MTDHQTKLQRYADLIVKFGINLQKDQPVLINADIEIAEFVRELVRKCYQNGASKVHVNWADPYTSRVAFEEAPETALTDIPEWRKAMHDQLDEQEAATIYLAAPQLGIYNGIDPKLIQKSQNAQRQMLKSNSHKRTSAELAWVIAGVPTKSWAATVFPDLDAEAARDKLWDYIFKMTRVDTEDYLERWNTHLNTLEKHRNFLNEKRVKKLHYKAPGTDLTIELPKDHIWMSAMFHHKNDYDMVVNIPTEEVFTAPARDGVNGYVSNTRPLDYGGNTIDGFKLTFENGRIVKVEAEENEDLLKELVETDEGAHHLGEVALVPDDSPISNTKSIFYNTLYDENASCHLAIGAIIPTTIEGGSALKNEEDFKAKGVNSSLTHVDFMVGSGDMDIDAETESGETITLFRNGNWAY